MHDPTWNPPKETHDDSLVQRNDDGELLTTSEKIAAGLHVDHASVLRNLDNHRADFERFGTVRFEIRSLPGGGKPARTALLNEHQATLLLTYARNNDTVREFKIRLVQEFYDMAKALHAPAPVTPEEQMALGLQAAQKLIEQKDRELEQARPAVAYVERFVSEDDVVTLRAWAAEFGLTEPKARDLLQQHKVIYRKSMGRRWSDSRQRLEPVYEWHAYAPYIGWFDRRPQHNAPRHHNGQVRTTLYVRQQHALDIAAALGITAAPTQPLALTA